MEVLIPLVSNSDQNKAIDLYQKYFELMYPKNSIKPFDGKDRSEVLSDWLSDGEIKFNKKGEHELGTVPRDIAELLPKKYDDRAVPPKWQGFMRANYKNGRRKDSLSNRARPKTGRGSTS